MTFAKFDERTLISDILRKLGISVNQFARLQVETPTLGAWTISRVLSGDKRDCREDIQKLLRLARACDHLQKTFPIPLDWSEWQPVQQALRQELVAQDMANDDTPQQVFDPSHRAI